jgi:hypothetical protein
MISSNIFGKSGNGTLDADIRFDVGNYGKNWDEIRGDRALDVSIDDSDLESIHSETYRIVFGEKPDLDIFNTTKLETILEKISIKFPMLCRFKDMYEDAVFESDEVKMLRDECVKLKTGSQDDATNLALRKLFYCCDEAIKSKLSLGFWCD